MMRHIDRTVLESSNVDIDPERTHLNYSFDMDHGGLTDFEYYKKRIDDNYHYGRGSKREDKAITGCGWVVTLTLFKGPSLRTRKLSSYS